tara:strand:+ start:28934 stop:29197 length:264 start_codon:yes stop_codon:yes gene_type:complete
MAHERSNPPFASEIETRHTLNFFSAVIFFYCVFLIAQRKYRFISILLIWSFKKNNNQPSLRKFKHLQQNLYINIQVATAFTVKKHKL